MNYTSIEQSKKLVELGLNPETADMAWIDRPLRVTDCPDVPVIMDIELESMIPQNKLIPCWSLGALLDLMPKCIVVDGENYISYIAALGTISYGNTKLERIVSFKYDTLFDSIFAMVIWLLENNYIKTEKP